LPAAAPADELLSVITAAHETGDFGNGWAARANRVRRGQRRREPPIVGDESTVSHTLQD